MQLINQNTIDVIHARALFEFPYKIIIHFEEIAICLYF